MNTTSTTLRVIIRTLEALRADARGRGDSAAVCRIASTIRAFESARHAAARKARTAEMIASHWA